MDDEIDEEILLELHRSLRKRYFQRCSYRKFYKNWEEYLDPTITKEDEFLEEFRMSTESFLLLYDIIKNQGIFQNNDDKRRGRKQHDTRLQLLITLHKLGLRAAKFSTIARKFKVSKGAARDSFNRVIQAIINLEKECVRWPDKNEREQLAIELQAKYGFRQCIGTLDGTLIGITERPEWYGEDFYSRKASYSLQALVVNDINCRILYYHFGWPGSTHDNRAWRNCALNRNNDAYFSPGEYLLADSAFSESNIIVPCYKSGPGKVLSAIKNLMNTYIAKPRVKSEHTIGILKNRFCCLKSLNIRIKSLDDMRVASRIFSACVILHNLLLDHNKDLPIDFYADLLKKVDDLDDKPENVFNCLPVNSSTGQNMKRQLVQNQLFRDYNLNV
jgi:hypothetical protein